MKATSSGFEEYSDALLRQFAKTRSKGTRDELVFLHHDLAVTLAWRFAYRGEPVEDLIQVAIIGLINAIDRYEPDRGIKFSSFATPTIVGELRRHFRGKVWFLKVPRRLQDISYHARQMEERLTQELGHNPSIYELTEALGADVETVVEAQQLQTAYIPLSLEKKMSEDQTLADFVSITNWTNEESDPCHNQKYESLIMALESLDPLDREIVELFYYESLTDKQIGGQVKLCEGSVWRRRNKALRRLQRLMSSTELAQN